MSAALSPAEWVDVPFEVQVEGRPRIDAFLAARLHRYSRAEVQRVIAEKRVWLKRPGLALAGPVKASQRVAKGDVVHVRYPRRDEPPAAYDSLPVVYEDDDLLAVDKPGNLLSHPTDRIFENTTTTILRKQFPRGKLHLVHRLDRETSGVLLLAKNRDAARVLTGSFESREVKKEYLAAVDAGFPHKKVVVDRPIGPDGGEIKVKQRVRADGAPAATEFVRLWSSSDRSVLLARPKTGRLHQIRVHLASLGFPIIGDKLYRGSGECYMKAVRRELTPEDLEALGSPRQLLHAWKIALKHPRTGAPLKIETEAPPWSRAP